VLRVFIAAGRGLVAAHAVGVIHRDFKPETSRFSLRTPSSRETPRISSLEGVGGKIGCPGLPLSAPGLPGCWPPLGHREGWMEFLLTGSKAHADTTSTRSPCRRSARAPSSGVVEGELETFGPGWCARVRSAWPQSNGPGRSPTRAATNTASPERTQLPPLPTAHKQARRAESLVFSRAASGPPPPSPRRCPPGLEKTRRRDTAGLTPEPPRTPRGRRCVTPWRAAPPRASG
jgi:hypothetical protein